MRPGTFNIPLQSYDRKRQREREPTRYIAEMPEEGKAVKTEGSSGHATEHHRFRSE
jgi:hypothetical protein